MKCNGVTNLDNNFRYFTSLIGDTEVYTIKHSEEWDCVHLTEVLKRPNVTVKCENIYYSKQASKIVHRN